MSTGRHGQYGGYTFAKVPGPDIQRSRLDRSRKLTTAFDAAWLVPNFVDEVIPGDTYTFRRTHFARVATPLHPVLDDMHVDDFYFFIPLRLLWTNFKRFMGEEDTPGDYIERTMPVCESPVSTGYAVGSLQDYMGIPPEIPELEHNALFTRAYNLVYQEWFRDENLVNQIPVDTDDGPDDPADYTLLLRAKRHDYFTSCLPWPQKGPAVELPLGSTAPVVPDGNTINWQRQGDTTTVRNMLMQVTSGNVTMDGSTPSPSDEVIGWHQATPQTGLQADLSSATASTINQIRQAFQIQRLYERFARGGTRYTELMRAVFGVISPDQRLQRPEYLGGSSERVRMQQVPQTSSTDVTSPQGNLAAYGISTGSGSSWTASFTEHGIILGLVNVRTALTYAQGLHRMFSRSTRFDYFWPALQHIGEQSVLNKEIYAQGSLDTTDDLVFGYQERYAEYKYAPNQVTGLMRPYVTGSLGTWNYAEDFSSLPALNGVFIADSSEAKIERSQAVVSEPQMLYDAYFQVSCARPMAMYSVPGMVDHF